MLPNNKFSLQHVVPTSNPQLLYELFALRMISISRWRQATDIRGTLFAIDSLWWILHALLELYCQNLYNSIKCIYLLFI